MSNVPPRLQTLINKAYLTIKEQRPEWYALITDIKWSVNSRMKRTLGRARMNQLLAYYAIEISENYFNTATEDGIYNTVVHEIAHIIAYRAYKDPGHGHMWRTVFTILGGNGERCAKPGENGYQAARNRVKRIILEKNGKEFKITPNRYNRYPEAYTRAGYLYRRTVIFNTDGTETLLHSVKEQAVFLDANLNVVAAQTT